MTPRRLLALFRFLATATLIVMVITFAFGGDIGHKLRMARMHETDGEDEGDNKGEEEKQKPEGGGGGGGEEDEEDDEPEPKKCPCRKVDISAVKKRKAQSTCSHEAATRGRRQKVVSYTFFGPLRKNPGGDINWYAKVRIREMFCRVRNQGNCARRKFANATAILLEKKKNGFFHNFL